MRKLRVSDILDSTDAVTSEDGEKVYEAICLAMGYRQETIIDFTGIGILTASFLNAALGRLFQDWTSEELNQFIHLYGFKMWQKHVTTQVIANAKRQYQQKGD